jgi:glycosyltransferase involved in cell wall biosynthesis
MSWHSQFGILRIIARLNVGGPAIQAILMTEAFRARGYDAVLVTGQVARGEANMDYLAQAHQVEVVPVPALSRSLSSGKDFLSLFQLVQILRRHRPAVVHTHTAKAGALGRLAAMIVGIPIRVHTFHGHVFDGYFSPRVTRAFLMIERFLARHTDCIIAISESQRKELTETYRIAPAHKVVIVPLGLDLAPFLEVNGHDGKLRAGLECQRSQPLVGWVGRFTAIKAPELFLHCVPLVKEACPAARFVMVGGGELWAECQQRIARDGLQNSVALLGWRRSLAELYADLDLVVCTSINEGTPVALLEAMASGKAIVSTDVGGVRDLMTGSSRPMEGMEVFENGILVKRDPILLAGAIRYLLSDPERLRAMGKAGREFVRNRFSKTRLADDLEHLYLALAGAKGLLPIDAASSPCGPASVFTSTNTQSL